MDVKQINSALGKLTKEERRTVRAALDFLEGRKSTGTTTQADTEDWLLPGIVAELRRRGLSYALPQKQLNKIAPDYATDSIAVRNDLRERLKRDKAQVSDDRIDHAELIAFGRVSARALADYLQPVAPIGLKFLLTNITKVPDALEASFPDYLSSGMLWILVQHGNGKDSHG